MNATIGAVGVHLPSIATKSAAIAADASRE